MFVYSSLYFGQNSLGQTVLTWVASTDVDNFTGDLVPLLQSLSSVGGPSATDYLGYLAFGSEALSASSNVTFIVSDLKLAVTRI